MISQRGCYSAWYAETAKLQVQTELERLHLEEARLDILKKARDLHETGRISVKAREHKESEYPQLLDELRKGGWLAFQTMPY